MTATYAYAVALFLLLAILALADSASTVDASRP